MTRYTWMNELGYSVIRIASRLVGVTLFGLRCTGREHLPTDGPVLVCSNHQSYIDPVIVGLVFNRRVSFLARKSLFRWAPFRWLLSTFGAIPLDRDGSGAAGLKESLRRLKHGEMLLMFPEGTRTRDGSIGPLQPGFALLARRSQVAVLPVAVDGAYDAWPRSTFLPRLTSVHVSIGPPIAPAELAQLDDEQLVAELERRLRVCHASARAARVR